jgi:hypothetical protein
MVAPQVCGRNRELNMKLKMAVFWVALMMEAVQISQTSVNSHQSTRRYNPEDGHLHGHYRENLRSYLNMDLLHTSNHNRTV